MTMKKQDWLVLLYCMLAAAGCLLVASKSSPLYPINDWTDANAYLSSGKAMLAGRVMYRDIYEHKGPLLYALHVLCASVDSAGFVGVLVLEVLAMGLFLMAAYRIMQLYGQSKTALLVLPLLAAVIIASFSFQAGDSAEELCLPLLGWSLYGLLKWLRQDAPERMSVQGLVMNGILCGCVLWIKFTMLGFYVPWILGMLLIHAKERNWRNFWSAIAWLAVGVGIATVPWLLYFGLNGALLPWIKVYLYDNLFLYQDEEALTLAGRAKAMFNSGWDWLRLNVSYTVPIVIGMIGYALLPTKEPHSSGDEVGKTSARAKLHASAAEKWFAWSMLAVAAFGVFVGGKSYVYYGLILGVFAIFGMLLLAWVLGRFAVWSKPVAAIAACVVLLGSVGYSYAYTPNRHDRFKPREDTIQYQLAAVVAQTPNATLLNYGFMDAGFYTACNIAPSVRFFHQTNVNLPEMKTEQKRYITEGVTDYVVTRGNQPADIDVHYEMVASAETPADFWYDQVFLFRKKGLLQPE